jgi:hypothetical protein
MKKAILSMVIVLIFLSSLVSAGLVSDVFNKITGKLSYTPGCWDSDGGDEIFQVGRAEDGKGGTGIDYCEGNVLTEYYCNQVEEVASRKIECPMGYVCHRGDCKERPDVASTSTLGKENSIVLVVGEEKTFGFDKFLVTQLAGGEADITYTKTIRVKNGDLVSFGGQNFDVVLGENVKLMNQGKDVEVLEKIVERVVEVEKEQVMEQVQKRASFWDRIFG